MPTSVPKRENEDHMALFRGKPSISYGDFNKVSSSAASQHTGETRGPPQGGELSPGKESGNKSGEYREDERTSSNKYARREAGQHHAHQSLSPKSEDIGEFVSMASSTPGEVIAVNEDDRIEPRTSISAPSSPSQHHPENDEELVVLRTHRHGDEEEEIGGSLSHTNVYVDGDEEMPIVTPSDDHSITVVVPPAELSQAENEEEESFRTPSSEDLVIDSS